ncbi:hypothetical protein C8Q79DRAFT_990675 [Trametes meyenii]|nr:hypothetical protein C8Q79DRAFT_990675 [Trametes meyenii]
MAADGETGEILVRYTIGGLRRRDSEVHRDVESVWLGGYNDTIWSSSIVERARRKLGNGRDGRELLFDDVGRRCGASSQNTLRLQADGVHPHAALSLSDGTQPAEQQARARPHVHARPARRVRARGAPARPADLPRPAGVREERMVVEEVARPAALEELRLDGGEDVAHAEAQAAVALALAASCVDALDGGGERELVGGRAPAHVRDEVQDARLGVVREGGSVEKGGVEARAPDVPQKCEVGEEVGGRGRRGGGRVNVASGRDTAGGADHSGGGGRAIIGAGTSGRGGEFVRIDAGGGDEKGRLHCEQQWWETVGAPRNLNDGAREGVGGRGCVPASFRCAVRHRCQELSLGERNWRQEGREPVLPLRGVPAG